MRSVKRFMTKTVACSTLLTALGGPGARGATGEEWTTQQLEVLAAMERLSESTGPGGAGADAYGEVLDADFSRWTLGSDTVDGKASWVEGVRAWFDDGWRVVDRRMRILEIHVEGDLAHTRRIVDETYAGPAGESSSSAAALVEVWRASEGGWKLLRVNVRTLDDDD